MMLAEADRAAIWERAKVAAAAHSWYGELLIAEGAEAHLPPLMTRELLDRYVGEIGTADAGEMVFATSGAASGDPRRVRWSAAEMAVNNELKRRLWATHVERRTRVAIDAGLGLASHSAHSVFTSLDCECLELPFDLPIKEHIYRLREFCPQVLYSMPSIVDALIAQASGSPVWSPERVILVGEPCSDVWKALIAARFRIKPADILDTYGCAEAGLIAHGCRDCERLHFVKAVIPEVLAAELVDEEWSATALAEGERVLVVTSRFRSGFPAVRFLTYDIVRGFGEQPCNGSMRLGIDAVLGRVGDEIKHGERISVYDIERGVLAVTPETRYQIVRGSEGRARLEFDQQSINAEQASAISRSVTATVAGAVAMTESRLAPPFEVRRVAALKLSDHSPKRRIVREGQ